MESINQNVEIGGGLRGVIVDTTELSEVNGQEGRLIYRGIEIKDLCDWEYEDIIGLLLLNEGKSEGLKVDIKKRLAANRDLSSGLKATIETMPKNAFPIDVLRTCVSYLGVDDPTNDSFNDEKNSEAAYKILASLPIIVASYHRYRTGETILSSDPELNEVENFLYLLTGKRYSKSVTDTLSLLYVLQAEHAFNNSTFTARVVSSSRTDLYSAITAAIASLKGPLHGGANQGIIPMLEEIGDSANVSSWLDKKLGDKKLIMGIGHPVYKTYDPRAIILKEKLKAFSAGLDSDKWMKISESIESEMLKRKGLYANIDFYSAPMYHSLGIPSDLFTPIFAIARSVGWLAHCFEQFKRKDIYRPTSKYVNKNV